MPQISIIITAYNVQDFIETAVRSALIQHSVSTEIIVIVDGATDRTADIVNSMKLDYPQLRVVVRENGGVSAARNDGLALATADFVMFLDGDDQLLPDACQQFLATALVEDADIVVSDYLIMKEGAQERRLKTASQFNTMTGFEFAIAILAPNSTVSVWNKLYKRSLFANVRFPVGISMGEDLLALFDVSLNAKKVVPLQVPTLIYLIRHSSLVNTSSTHLLSITSVMKMLNMRLSGSKLSPELAADVYQATAFYHVMYARVVRDERFGNIHKQMYEWYQAEFNDYSSKTLAFIDTLKLKERLLIQIYRRSYRIAVSVVRVYGLLRRCILTKH